LLAEMLDEWERRGTIEVIAQVDAEGEDAIEKMRRVGQLAGEHVLRAGSRSAEQGTGGAADAP
jgi:peptidyl-tRNA hydrolase